MSTQPNVSRSPFETTSVQIGGNVFVSGLLWKSLKKFNAYMTEAREFGKERDLDIVSIRKGQLFQGGFVKKSNGVVKGMYSLAAAVAGQFKEESWIAVFALPDGRYALVAGKGGMILPGCDVVGDRDRIYDYYRDKCNSMQFRFEGRYIPEDFNDGGKQLDIEELLAPKRLNKEYKLKPLFFGLSNKELTIIGIGALLVAALAIGALQWKSYLDEQEAIAAQKRQQEEERKLALLEQQRGEALRAEVLRHPWTTMPSFSSFLAACQGETNSLPLSVAGWVFESVNCTGGQIDITYTRTGNSSVNEFTTAAKAYFESEPAFVTDGNRAVVNRSLKTVFGGDDPIETQNAAVADFGSYLQKIGIQGQIEIVPYVPPKPPEPLLPGVNGSNEELPVPDWIENSWSFETNFPPELLLKDMNLQGMRLTEITANLAAAESELSWTIKGRLYARKN